MRSFRKDKRGASNVIVFVLGLVIVVIIVANVFLFNYEMNQLDWEKTREGVKIIGVERNPCSGWFVTQSEYTVTVGSRINGTYEDTQSVDGQYESFREAPPPAVDEILRPNAGGQYAEWGTVYPLGTVHWDCCDEQPPDDDASYVQTADNIYKKEAYNLFDHTASGIINWIRVYVRAKKTAGPPSYIRTLVRTNGTDYESADLALSTSYQNQYTQYNINPNTGQPWTWSEIDALQAGASSRDFGASHVRMTAVWVVVNYTTTSAYELDINGTFVVDVSTYPLAHVQTVEIQLMYKADDSGEKWYLKAYNWTMMSYGHDGFNSTTGYTPTTGWDYYAVNLTDKWSSYVHNNGTIRVQLLSEGPDGVQTRVDIDFLAVRVLTDGVRFTFRNNGSVTCHLVSLWIINSTIHQHHDIDVFINSGDTYTYTRADINLPDGQCTVKVVLERGNIEVYSVD